MKTLMPARPPLAGESSLAARLPQVEQDVLAYLHAHGPAPGRQLTRHLPWPRPLVLMGVGALLKRRMIQDTPRELEWLLLPITRDLKRLS